MSTPAAEQTLFDTPIGHTTAQPRAARPVRPRPPRPRPVAADVQAICAALVVDPAHTADRDKLVRAIVLDARANRGRIDPNRVRARLANPTTGRPDVTRPQLVGAVYQQLASLGVITFDDWVISTDRASGNSGRPVRTYRLKRIPETTTRRAA